MCCTLWQKSTCSNSRALAHLNFSALIHETSLFSACRSPDKIFQIQLVTTNFWLPPLTLHLLNLSISLIIFRSHVSHVRFLEGITFFSLQLVFLRRLESLIVSDSSNSRPPDRYHKPRSISAWSVMIDTLHLFSVSWTFIRYSAAKTNTSFTNTFGNALHENTEIVK